MGEASPPPHHTFTDLPELLRPGDLLVVNDTRVVKARLLAEKDSGGRAEVLLERIFGDPWREWSARTPALIPNKFAGGGPSENHWSFAKSLRANLEPVIVIYALICLWWLWRQLPAA